MIGLVIGLREQVCLEFDLGRWERYFYRDCLPSCKSCARYYKLLDACPLRMSQQRTGRNSRPVMEK